MGEENRSKALGPWTLDSDLSTSQGIQPAGRITLVGLSGCKKDNSKKACVPYLHRNLERLLGACRTKFKMPLNSKSHQGDTARMQTSIVSPLLKRTKVGCDALRTLVPGAKWD
ncbi:unnamed protein product [Leuciscus chuanchicus]